MLRHIKEGGNPYDELGSHIISLSEEFAQLSKFRNYAKKRIHLLVKIQQMLLKVLVHV